MAPKAPEKSPQSHQQPQEQPVLPPVKLHSSPFYISARDLCRNRRLKQKRSKYADIISNGLSLARAAGLQKKTELRRRTLNMLTAEVTIDLLSDDESSAKSAAEQYAIVYPDRMCLERAALLGLMPVERLGNSPLHFAADESGNAHMHQRHSTPNQLHNNNKQQLQQQQQQQQLKTQSPRKRKSRPQKRKSLPPPVLLNSESIVLSDDSDTDAAPQQQQQQSFPMPFIPATFALGPDLTVIYPTSQQIPCQVPQPNSIQVDEEVTISLVPRSPAIAKRNPVNSLNHESPFDPTATGDVDSAPFPMLPDETTVHTVIANRIYELSLTKLREGLASCGIPEFNDGTDQQKKISPPRRKGAVNLPPQISPPQAPISLKLSSDLSISLISDDEDEGTHHRQHETLLSPAFLQKLPVNVSISPANIATPRAATTAADPRKLKLG